MVALLLAALLSSPTPSLPPALEDLVPRFPEAGQEVPGRYIIAVKDGANISALAKKHGLRIEHHFSAALSGFTATGAPVKLSALRNDPAIASVEVDRRVSIFAQTLPRGVNRIDADLSSIAKINNLDERVDADIAILDTGIQKSHPDLNVAGGYNCTSRKTANWNDGNGHGTHVAGTAAAKDNSSGVVGVAPGARLWGVKVLDNSGSGFLSWIICGVDYVTRNASKIEVANMSLGGEFTSSILNNAIANSVAQGVTYAVAAGNAGLDAATFSPASHPDVLTVSALADSDGRCGSLGSNTAYGRDDTFASFSNFGSVVDVIAPGVNIYSTYKGSKYTTMSGTSMASPHVAGATALYLATHGRDVNGDSLINGDDVAATRAALAGSAVSPGQACDTTANNGFGGFTGDPDEFPEPLIYAGN